MHMAPRAAAWVAWAEWICNHPCSVGVTKASQIQKICGAFLFCAPPRPVPPNVPKPPTIRMRCPGFTGGTDRGATGQPRNTPIESRTTSGDSWQ